MHHGVLLIFICFTSAPDAVELQLYESEKSFPHIYETTLLFSVSRIVDFVKSPSLLLLTNAVLFVALETDKYTDTKLCIYFNIYSQEKHGSGNVNAITPSYATHFSYAAMLSREVSPPPALLAFLLSGMQWKQSGFMLSTELRILSPFLLVDKLSSG